MEQEVKFYEELLKVSQDQAKRIENVKQEQAKMIQQYKETITEYEELCTKQQKRLQEYQELLGMDFTLREEEKEKPEPN